MKVRRKEVWKVGRNKGSEEGWGGERRNMKEVNKDVRKKGREKGKKKERKEETYPLSLPQRCLLFEAEGCFELRHL
jgi:hypothetical protein